jgi:hypothetical protein
VAGSFLFDEKTRQSDALYIFWFGLRDVGILLILYTHELSSKEQLLSLRIFGARFGGLDGFLYEAAQNFEVFSNISNIQDTLKGRTCTIKKTKL